MTMMRVGNFMAECVAFNWLETLLKIIIVYSLHMIVSCCMPTSLFAHTCFIYSYDL